jgi:hypothetical protein
MLGIGTVHWVHADTIKCKAAEVVRGWDSTRRFLYNLLLSANVVPRVYGKMVTVLYLTMNLKKDFDSHT